MAGPDMQKPFPFLELPPELREQIYSNYFSATSYLQEQLGGGRKYNFDLSILRTNKQVHNEARKVFRKENVFLRIETPWKETEHHVATEGCVPIVCSGKKAELFFSHHCLVQVAAPELGFIEGNAFVIHLNHLHLFSQIWFYSSLNYPTLNEQIRITWTLQDPYTVGAEECNVPVALQRKLLLPFDRIKGLLEANIYGFERKVEEELRVGMAVPYDSAEQCLEKATDRMDSGDIMMQKKQHKGALEEYLEAFRSMHIQCTGRDRVVWADPFFHQELDVGRYEGQIGTAIRVILRIRLVSRVVDAYLKLQQWEEAAFWGVRSITIMREQMTPEFDDFLSSFAAMHDVGMLCIRTAIAIKVLEVLWSPELKNYQDTMSAGQLFVKAKRYIQDQKVIDREIDSNQTNWKEAVPISISAGSLSLRANLAADQDVYENLD